MKSTTETLAEALRLTRNGQVLEATTRLRDLLGAASPQNPAPRPSPGREPKPLAALPGLAQIKLPAALKGLTEKLGRVAADLGVAGETRVAAPLAEGAQFLSRSFANAAGQRAYKLYIPSRYAGQPMPLVVMLHGCTQSPDDFAAGTGMNRVAEEEGVLVVYPAQSKAANAQTCWNWFQPQDQARDRGEPSLLAGITREVMAEFAIDPTRVYVAGLSAGGAAAANLAALYPDLFAAFGVHSGLPCGAARDLPSALAAMKQGAAGSRSGAKTPVIVFHGDRDHVVHPANGDAVIRGSAATEGGLRQGSRSGRSAGGRAYTVESQVDADGRPVLEQWIIHGAGHAWSGGDPSGSYTDPSGPDASREMMRFFLSHHLG